MSMSLSSAFYGTHIEVPEECEYDDIENLKAYIEEYMNVFYSEFDPEIVNTAHGKEYFLPALKVLDYNDGQYASPSHKEVWKDLELVAECERDDVSRFGYFGSYIHSVPHEDCDCGIYGSVNLEEIEYYLKMESPTLILVMHTHLTEEPSNPPNIPPIKKLCIIEPSPDADVILCRKGWKASKAFISEVINETISVYEASELLSIAWKRKIDVGRVFNENR